MSTLKVDNIVAYSGTHVNGTFSGVFSGSFDSSRIDALEAFSSSLDSTFATDLVVNSLSGAFNSFTAALDNTYATDAQLYQLYQATASLNAKTGSLATTGSNTFNGNQIISGSIYLENDRAINFGTNNTYVGMGEGALLLRDSTGYIQLDAQNLTNYAQIILNADNEDFFYVNHNTTDNTLKFTTNGILLLNEIPYDSHLATTGSNTFNGNQTINGVITLDNNSVIKDNANQSISFGVDAAETGQGTQSTAIGSNAGQTDQGNGATALGALAGNLEQGQSAVAIGALAGSTQQGDWAIAIGAQAGGISQGNYSIALGNLAGGLNQAPNSVVINATGTQLDNTTTSSLKIAPIRINDDGSQNVLVYNTSTKEVSYSVNKFATTGSNTFIGTETISGSILISGSIIPSTNSTSYTSSYSLGSSTNAWKELWVSNGSVNFVDPNSGDTASISLNERNVLSVPQIESVGNLNVTGSFGARNISLEGYWDTLGGGDNGGMIIFSNAAHRIYNHSSNNLTIHSHNAINFYITKLYDENAKLNVTGSVKIYGDRGIGPGVYNPSDTALEVIGNSEITGSVYVSGSNSTIVLPNHSSAPSSPNSGALYFNTTDFHFYGWNGGEWKQLDN